MLHEKMDRKLEDLMKVLNEITYKHNYLENKEVQGSSRTARALVKCPRKTTLS